MVDNNDFELENKIITIVSIIAGVVVAQNYSQNKGWMELIGFSVLAFLIFYIIFKLAVKSLEVVSALIYPLSSPFNFLSNYLSTIKILPKFIKSAENFWKKRVCLGIIFLLILSILFLIFRWGKLNWINKSILSVILGYALFYNIMISIKNKNFK